MATVMNAELAQARDEAVDLRSALDDALVDKATNRNMALMFLNMALMFLAERDKALEIVRAVAALDPLEISDYDNILPRSRALLAQQESEAQS